jgi:hypothetical protein
MSNEPPFPILNGPAGESSPDDLATLRSDAATALEQALAFIEARQDSLALLRAHILLEATDVEEGLTALAERQHADGSFDPIGGIFSPDLEPLLCDVAVPTRIRGAVEAMSILADWRVLYSPVAEGLVSFLASNQQADGGWGEDNDETEASIPRLFVSGMLAGYGGRTRSARPMMLRNAQGYLASHWSVERIRKSGWPLVAAYAHFYTNVRDDNADVALPWCGRELERGYRAGEYSARESMRVLLYCDASALPGTEFEVTDLLTKLQSEQNPDGSYADPTDAPDARIAATLDAIAATLRLCRMLPNS